MNQKVTLIIPSYNERENIKNAILTIKKQVKNLTSYEFIYLIVDDNSPDGTGQIVKKMMKVDKSIHLLSGRKNGLGNAMIRGTKYALTKLHPDIIISTEADLAYDAKIIPEALKKIEEGYDLVVASRDVKGGATKGWTISRKVNHWVANKLFATWIAGENKIKDHNGAFRAVKVKGLLEKINFKDFPNGFGFFNYSLFKLNRVSNKGYEMPVRYNFRTKGESKISFNPKYAKTYVSDIFEYISICFRIRSEKKQG